MEPFDSLPIPSPDECLGGIGVLISIVGAVFGLVWLTAWNGGVWSFGFVVACGFLGWVSFMTCVAWGQTEREPAV
jgi:hypothetical protein